MGEDDPSSSVSGTSDILGRRDDDSWEDVEPEQEQDQIVSLLDKKIFQSVGQMLAYCKGHYNFDFLSVRQRYALDFYGCVKLVNFIRAEVKRGRSLTSDILQTDFDKDEFLKPVLDDDALLFSLDDLPTLTVDVSDTTSSVHATSTEESRSLIARVVELEEELRISQLKFSDYRRTVIQTLDDRWDEGLPSQNQAKQIAEEEKTDDDKHYFSSYSYNDIHETMLKDTVRTDAYRDFIYNNKHFFVNKTVLDVGCGTGILSLFCAKAGALRVFAVENSDIIDKARENIFNNGFSETIVCLRGRVEDINLPVEKVDIIVSEWMGYCLLYEAMLGSVIWARDKYLSEDGLMVPSYMNMWVAPISDPEYIMDHIAFWRDVYGFDMKAMQAGIYDDSQILHMPRSALCGSAFPFLQLNLHSTTVKDLVFKRGWKTKLSKNIDAIDGFIIWFDAFFTLSRHEKVSKDERIEEHTGKDTGRVAFTTGPLGKETHWRQGVFFIENRNASTGIREDDEIIGEVEYRVPAENSRALDVSISWTSSPVSTTRCQTWKLR